MNRCCCRRTLARLTSDRHGPRPDGDQLVLLAIVRAGVLKQSVMTHIKAVYSRLVPLVTTVWHAVVPYQTEN